MEMKDLDSQVVNDIWAVVCHFCFSSYLSKRYRSKTK